MNSALTTTDTISAAISAAGNSDEAEALPDGPPAGILGHWKRLGDLLVSAIILIMISPTLFSIAILITIFDGVPFIYAHSRVGKDGRTFTLLKFRTMRRDADDRLEALLQNDPSARNEWEKHRKLRDDPRITKFGRFLRRSSLDELPQLINVLKGDMSLVGPRPIVADELSRFGTMAPAYIAARPGITGLWQISGRNDTDYTSRIKLDVEYIRQWSLRRDIEILVKTVPAVLCGKGAY